MTFCCILTTSSDQHIKSIKYHIYKATKSIAKIKVFLLQNFIDTNATKLVKITIVLHMRILKKHIRCTPIICR